MFSGIPANVLEDILASLVLAILAGLGVWLRRQLKGVSQMTQDWNGVDARPGVADGTPGVMQRLYAQDRQFEHVMRSLGHQDTALAEIQHEISYNSGSSIKDAVHRTDNAVQSLRADVDSIKANLEAR